MSYLWIIHFFVEVIMGKVIENLINSPIKGKTKLTITSEFGKRRFYNNITKRYETSNHKGLDLVGGDEIVSLYDGKVSACRNTIKGYSEKYSSGNYVTIKHDNGLITTYMHLKYGSVKVKKGNLVCKGQVIGLMGSTGKATGKHLHLGIKKNNKWVDPKEYLVSDTGDNSETYYIVKKGDNLSKIARKYNTTWQSIYAKNKKLIGDNPNLIRIGQKLVI